MWPYWPHDSGDLKSNDRNMVPVDGVFVKLNICSAYLDNLSVSRVEDSFKFSYISSF